MKQLEHGNILPFYGVSTTVADFCLVFPWYENGGIVDYLKKNPGINRFALVSGPKQVLYSSRRLPTRTVIWCGQRIAVLARKSSSPWCLETGTQSCVPIDKN